jgi:hypothetical protein
MGCCSPALHLMSRTNNSPWSRRQHIIGDSALTTDELSESMGTSFRIAIQGDITQVAVEGKHGNRKGANAARQHYK